MRQIEEVRPEMEKRVEPLWISQRIDVIRVLPMRCCAPISRWRICAGGKFASVKALLEKLFDKGSRHAGVAR
jgi:hypothetical protein